MCVQYEYDEEMESAYRASLLKSFKKNIDGGYFPFLIGTVPTILMGPKTAAQPKSRILDSQTKIWFLILF